MAVDMFLKLKNPDVTGEATDAEHKGEIDVVSWSWGIQGSRDVATGTAAAKSKLNELLIVKRIDRSSPVLMQLAKNNKVAELGHVDLAQGRDDAAHLFHDRAEERARHGRQRANPTNTVAAIEHRRGGTREPRVRPRDGHLHAARVDRRQGWR